MTARAVSAAASPTPLLALEGVRVRAPRGAVLVERFDLDLAAGESAALVGASGCGKTLLLRVAAGLDRPDAGERRVSGSASRSAFVFQEGGLLRNVTVLENLRLPLYYRGIGSRAAGDAALAALEKFGVAAVADERPGGLLNETRILVQCARAAAMEADLLFLDEPFPQLSRHATGRVARWLEDELATGRRAVLMTGVDPESVPSFPGGRFRAIGLGRLTPFTAPKGGGA